jgi:hypothetical protein
MRRSHFALVLVAVLLAWAPNLEAQSYTVDDPVIERMWQEGMENSQAMALAQVLLDSLGPRLTGTPEYEAASEWLLSMYRGWGVDARNEQYGTWMGWERGITHIDLVEPRVRSLHGINLAWSPGGKKKADVIILPDFADSDAFASWLPQVKGKFVAVSFPEPTCRPDDNWEENATSASFEKMREEREAAREEWGARFDRIGVSQNDLPKQLEEAGAVGVLTGDRPSGWGVMRIFSARTEKVPTLILSCEDYGLVARLAMNGQSPVIDVEAKAKFRGEVPVFNTIAEIRRSEKPDEYIVLSAHFDSWDGGSGATDNGTGTITILEAMRIIRAAYPNPKRTITAGHWNSEEQGLNGARGFAASHPEVVYGLQALFNQDNGTGRIVRASMQGLTHAGTFFSRWLTAVPTEISQHMSLQMPGRPGGGGSDYAAFVCAGAPAFFLGAHNWSYFPYTWHTNLDTYDKLVADDLKNNATLFAMLTYMASEDPDLMPRDQRVLPLNPRTGEQMTWPQCREPRTWESYRNR